MAKPAVYGPPIAQTNASVQDGSGNSKNSGKSKARFPNTPKMPNQSTGVSSGIKHRAAQTPGAPAGA
jgi:hypothetical protein